MTREIIEAVHVIEKEKGIEGATLIAALVVSQFTLIVNTAKGNRPSFVEAAEPEVAEGLYEAFCAGLTKLGVFVETGVFAARMRIEIANEGPVTIVLG